MKIYRKQLLVVVLLLVNVCLFAQKDGSPTPQDVELAKKLKEQYSKSDIAVTESKENIVFGFNKKEAKVTVTNTVSERLMGISESASIQKYEFYDDQSSIAQFNFKSRNNKNVFIAVNDELYKDKDLFYNDARVKYATVSFPQRGYSYVFELQKLYKDSKYFTAVYFNDEHPVIKKEIKFTIPKSINIELKEFNFEGFTIKKEKTENSDKTITYTYTLENVPAIVKDEDAPGRSYIYPHIVILTKGYTFDGKEVKLFNSAADLYKWYKSLINMMKDDSSVFAGKVKELTSKAKSDEEKIKNIFYWVQDNIRYIAFEDGIAGFKPDESNNVFQKRYGDCKGMANLIKQMLKVAGYDARLTWIGTKHIAYDYSTPSLAINNHMICTVFLKGKKIFLDGTEKFNSFGEFANRIQEKEVMIEDGEKFIIEKVPATTSDFNKETYSASFKIENEKLVGKCHKKYNGESRTQFHQIYNTFESDKKQQALQNYLSENDKNQLVTEVKTSDLKNREEMLTIDYNLAIANKVSNFDKEWYIDLGFMDEYKGFDLKERTVDYVFDFKKNYESNVTLEIPQGLKVTKIPENISYSDENCAISIVFEKTANAIVYKKLFNFKNGVIRSKDLKKWNEFIVKLNKIYNQQIVLTN